MGLEGVPGTWCDIRTCSGCAAGNALRNVAATPATTAGAITGLLTMTSSDTAGERRGPITSMPGAYSATQLPDRA